MQIHRPGRDMTRVCSDQLAVDKPGYLVREPLDFVSVVIRNRSRGVWDKDYMSIAQLFVAVDVGLDPMRTIGEKFKIDFIMIDRTARFESIQENPPDDASSGSIHFGPNGNVDSGTHSEGLIAS